MEAMATRGEAQSTVESPIPDSLYERLRRWRWQRARELDVPVYYILSNAHLAGIAVARPITPDQLGTCPGIGPKKLEQFGPELLQVVQAAVADGLASGIPAPDEAGTPLNEAELAEVAAALRADLANRIARRFQGRFSPAQVAEALSRLPVPSVQGVA